MFKLSKANLRLMIIETLDEIGCDMDELKVEDDDLDEFSGAGGGSIAGYQLPLGMRPNVSKKSK